MKIKRNYLLSFLLTTVVIATIFFAWSCAKEEPVEFPALTTLSVTEITSSSAKSGGNIIYNGGAEVNSRGLVWDTAANPSLEQHAGLTFDGSGTGLFTSYLSILIPRTTYYIRAYAINSAGTAYGNQINFTTLEQTGKTFTDPRDGNVYQMVTIGKQVWMAENLKYLPSVIGPGTGSQTIPYHYVYGYDGTSVTDAKTTANYQTYGVLYNWPAAFHACPPGWHLPTDAEWKALEMELGMSLAQADATGWRGTDEGGRLKETGTKHWVSPNTSATNESGFSALPGGSRMTFEAFRNAGYYSYWWGASEFSNTYVWNRYLLYNASTVYRGYYLKDYGFSVRCIRNY